MKTQIVVSNVKCQGCAKSIKNGLKTFPEVSEVTVDVLNQKVDITHDESLAIEKIKNKLASMGYPENGSLEGFDKLAASARAYVSCVIG